MARDDVVGGDGSSVPSADKRRKKRGRTARRAQHPLRRRFSLGRIRRRRLGGTWTSGRPFGRGEIVADFHLIRQWDEPPVFVIQGVRGHQKSELLDYLRYSFSQRQSWSRAEEVDAKIDFFAIDPEPETTFASLCAQLSANSSVFRQLRFPCYRRIRELLVREQRQAGVPPTHVSAFENDLGWLAKLGLRVASIWTHTQIPTPSRTTKIISLARDLWWRISPTSAGRWMRQCLSDLPGPRDSPDSSRRRMAVLRHALAAATAEDLRRSTRRRTLPVNEVAVFIDGYHRVERSAQPNFVVDFAQDIADARARVLIVIACREQERWTKVAVKQPDFQDFGVMKVSKRIQIHQLQPLAWTDRIHALSKYEVEPSMAKRLADLSAGMPVALRLLGEAFGKIRSQAPASVDLLDELPDPQRTDGHWFETFSEAVATHMAEGLEERFELHLRAASTLRNFDRDLLAALLGNEFSDRSFEALVGSGFVGTSRPSSLLGAERSYRVRSFAREFTVGTSEPTAVNRWHEMAAQRFADLAKATDDLDQEFQLQTEELFHRLFINSESSKLKLFECFQVELLRSRTDRCEAILRMALDYDRTNAGWRAMVLANAGKMYLARDRYELAEERLREAKTLVSLDDEDPRLAVSISLALAKCHRAQETFDKAHEELSLLSGQQDVHPVVEFQCRWSECLEARGGGHLTAARELAEDATHLLDELLGSGENQFTDAAAFFGLGSLPRKRIHLVRFEADLARRMGDYITSDQCVDRALVDYREDPEDGIEGYTLLIRAHVLRQEGHFNEAYDLAESIYHGFADQHPRDLRGAGQALRCMGQARLCSSDPEAARPLLEEMATMDPKVYPSSRSFALFGFGELERRQGSLPEARRYYRESERASEGRDSFERCYLQLGRIEIARIEKTRDVNADIRAFLARPGVVEHPALEFSAHLLQIRVNRAKDALVKAARDAEARFVRRDEARPELQMLEETLTAIELGTELPTLVLNLP